MSLKFSEFLLGVVSEGLRLPADRLETRSMLEQCHKKEFWREVLNEDTGEFETVPVDRRTHDAFKDQCDINKILEKAQQTGAVSHLSKYKETYGDYSDYDFFTHERMLREGNAIFSDLPSEMRKEFNNNPQEFFDFVNKPDNADRLHVLFPKLAEPGKYFPDVSPSSPPGALKAPPEQQPEAAKPASAPAAPPAAPAEGAAPVD